MLTQNAPPLPKNTPQYDTLPLKSASKSPLTVSKDHSLNRKPSRDADFATLKSNGTFGTEHLQPHRVENVRGNGISRTESETDSLLDLYRNTSSRGNSSLDFGEKSVGHDSQPANANEGNDDEKWIHRDKLAKIESEELQAAGFKLATTPRTSSRTRPRRAPSSDRQSEGTNSNDQDSWPAAREEKRQRVSSPVEEEQEQEQNNWDLRSPAEIAADTPEKSDTKVYQNPGFKKSKSKIPILAASTIPVLDKDAPRPRTRASSRPQTDDDQPSQSKTHSRVGSAASQTLLNDIASGAIPPKSPTTTPPESRNEGSPSKRKVTPRTPQLASTSTPGSRKVTPASRKVSNARPRSGSSSSPAQRPTTRSGDDRPRTAINRPEGDPPWLATMYKPDPMLPPDQQIIPTHAKRQQQAQWAEDGSIPKVYDRNFTPLAIHTNDGLKPSAPPKNSPPAPSPEKDGQQAWPMKELHRAPSNGSRPGTSGTDRGGYSTMPKVTTSPAMGSLPSPRLSPRPSVPGPQADTMSPQSAMKVTKLPALPETGKKEKGCSCCLVM